MSYKDPTHKDNPIIEQAMIGDGQFINLYQKMPNGSFELNLEADYDTNKNPGYEADVLRNGNISLSTIVS